MSFQQFQSLLEPGVLGFYNSCEVTICALLDHDENAYNVYTIYSFGSKCVQMKKEQPFLTNKKEYFGKRSGKRLRLIVVQYDISLEEAKKDYGRLSAGGKTLNTCLGMLQFSSCEEMLSTFVPVDSTQTVLLNRILKNNFCGGSMVFEFFANKDELYALIDEKGLQKVLNRIRELIPIDLVALSDHIGNVVFQFPSEIAFCQLTGSSSETSCIVKFDKRIESTGKYVINTATVLDNALFGPYGRRVEDNYEVRLTLGETGGPYVITVMDLENHIPVLQQTTSMMRSVESVLQIAGDADSVRTIRINNETETITVNSGELVCAGRPEYQWKTAMEQRRYQRRLTELARKREFVQYGKGENNREKGISDLRALMNVGPQTRVYLWDPYLSAKDLLETWYFTDTYGLELRAITSGEIVKREKGKTTVKQWVENQREELENGSNQLGIHLQWRIQYGRFGFSFHDRFLIQIPPDGETPRVWSLGTSVNSFGKKHHILQLVSNPGYIADAFEELWEELADESCLVWDSKRRNGG